MTSFRFRCRTLMFPLLNDIISKLFLVFVVLNSDIGESFMVGYMSTKEAAKNGELRKGKFRIIARRTVFLELFCMDHHT